MKIPQDEYTSLKNDFRSVIKNYFEPKLGKTIRPGDLTVSEQWTILHKVSAFRDYPDDNVNTVGRCIEKNNKGVHYLYQTLDLNDATLGTTIKKICTDLQKEIA